VSVTENHLGRLRKRFNAKLSIAELSEPNRIRLQVLAEDLLEIMQFTAIELNFTSLEAISGVDYDTYFEVVYHVDKWDGDPTVLQVHVKLNDRENPAIPTITPIWESANWHERELFDLFGINVIDHPNLKRLLLPEEWDDYEHKHISELHPMRRDYHLAEKPFSFKPHPK